MDILSSFDMKLERRKNPAEGSYTCYLSTGDRQDLQRSRGIAETIIAAKNGSRGA